MREIWVAYKEDGGLFSKSTYNQGVKNYWRRREDVKNAINSYYSCYPDVAGRKMRKFTVVGIRLPIPNELKDLQFSQPTDIIHIELWEPWI